jgi:hypothetical protein
MSSRLALDQHGRTVVVVTTPSLSLQVGDRFLVVDLFELGFTRPGRPPTARERAASSKFFYDSNSAKRARAERPEIPDELLADEEAVRLAYCEQRRTPPDLVNVAA